MTRLGILKADVVADDLRTRFGDYGDMIDALLQRDGGSVNTRVYEVHRNQFPDSIHECDAYLISGSRKSVYDQCEWIERLLELVEQLHSHKKKLVGLCFGHQAVSVALGGEVGKHVHGWGVGAHEYRSIPVRSWMKDEVFSVRLLCSHQDQVLKLPPGAENFLTSEFCRYAGMVIGDHVFTLQPHPEFSKGFAECLLHMREEELGQKFETAVKSLAEPLDVAVANDWIQSFLAN